MRESAAVEGEVMDPTTTDVREVATRPDAITPIIGVMEQAAIAELKIAAQIAKMYPRNDYTVRETLKDACLRPKFAETARYSKPIGNTQVKGLSIRFAEEAMRAMGNIRVTELVIFDSEEERVTSVTAWDCQTMAHTQKAVVTKKVVERRSAKGRIIVGDPEGRPNSYGDKVFTVRATEDEVLVKESASCSKVRRNLILSLIPADLKEEAEAWIEKTTSTRDAADPAGEMKKLVDGFGNLRVKVQSLEAWLGHAVNEASPAEIATLREVYTSVRDGEASFADHLAMREDQREAAGRRPVVAVGSAVGMQSKARQQGARAGAVQQQPPTATTTATPPPAKKVEGADAKAVAKWVADVRKLSKASDELLAYAIADVFGGVTDAADIAAEDREQRRDELLDRIKSFEQPMGSDMGDRVYESIDSHFNGEEAKVQNCINLLCAKFGVSLLDDVPVYGAQAWKTLG